MAPTLTDRQTPEADLYLLACLMLAQFILTLLGVAGLLISCLLGLFLSAMGLTRSAAKPDLVGFLLLLLYAGMCMFSSLAVYGNLTLSYGPSHLLFPLLYLLLSTMSGRESALLRRLCALWAAVVALWGLGEFLWRSLLLGAPRRLGGLLGNPNALGIFLVVGWFLLQDCLKDRDRIPAPLPFLEPFLLIALSLTLSMGSFVALAAGMFLDLLIRWRKTSLRDALNGLWPSLAKATLCFGTGILLYLSVTRTEFPLVALLPLAYALALSACWPRLEAYLTARPRAAFLLALLGLLVAVGAVAIRPSALATFAQRLEMMKSGLAYLPAHPLTGVGAYRWRFLDMADGGTYFNTWHIHNSLLHVGVEMGWIAMAALIFLVLHFFRKDHSEAQTAAFTAFLVHNMMDTSFFYTGITSLVLLSAARPRDGGKPLSGRTTRLLFAGFALLFAFLLFYYLFFGREVWT